jgi:hypothetical protein
MKNWVSAAPQLAGEALARFSGISPKGRILSNRAANPSNSRRFSGAGKEHKKHKAEHKKHKKSCRKLLDPVKNVSPSQLRPLP